MEAPLVPRKRARVVTTIFYFISGLVTATWASRIPDIQQKLLLTDGQLGLILFSLPVGLFVAMPVSAWLVAKYGSANLMAFAALLFVGLLCFIGLSGYTWQLVISLLLYGICRNFFNISLNTHSVEVQKLYDKPVIVAFHGVWSVACLFAAGLGTLMIYFKVPVHWHFLLVAALSSIVCFTLWNYKLYNQPPVAEKKPLFVKPDKYLFLLGLVAFCTMLSEGITFDWCINYFNKVVGVQKGQSTYGYTAFIIAMSLGRLTGDKIIGKVGTTVMLILNGIFISLGFLLVVLFPTLTMATLGFLLVGAGSATTIPVVYSMAGRSTKMQPSYALTAVTMIGFMGFLLGPLIAGSISGAIGMKWIFVVTLLLGMCVPFLAILIGRIKE